MPQHRTFLQTGLDHIVLAEGIIGGTALEGNHDIRLQGFGVGKHAALPYFLLGREGSHDIAGKFLILQAVQNIHDNRSADPVVERLAVEQSSFLIEVAADIRHTRTADAKTQRFCFLFGYRTAVKNHIRDFQRSVLFFRAHEMRRLAGNDSLDQISVFGS